MNETFSTGGYTKDEASLEADNKALKELTDSYIPPREIIDGTSAINHPKHYNSHPSGIEAIAIVEHMNFNIGNAIKYLWRSDHKHNAPLDDLRKAVWYINREIQRLEPPKPKKKEKIYDCC